MSRPSRWHRTIVMADRVVYLRKALGTIARVTIARDAARRASGLEVVIDHVLTVAERTFSRYRPDSELSRLNQGQGAMAVSKAMWMVLAVAQSVCEATGGVFNVAYRSPGVKPGVVGCFRYRLLYGKKWAVILGKHTILDLDGLAKGWTIGRIAAALKRHGVRRFIVEIGGDLVVGGGIHGPWRIGIRNPGGPSGPSGVLRVLNTAVCTSGTYRRGRHIVNPMTGQRPTHTYSATVLGPDPAVADALATAAFISGPGANYYKRFKNYGFVFVDSSGVSDAEGLVFGELVPP